MKFLIDAQLPPSLKKLSIDKGHDCLHTLDLELKNETPDNTINYISIREKRIVITKDSDFFNSFVLRHQPYKLILVKLGNTSKDELIEFFAERFDQIIEKIAIESMILLKRD